jgi:hypothetical protein
LLLTGAYQPLDRQAYVLRLPAESGGKEEEATDAEYRLLEEYFFTSGKLEGVETLQEILKRESAAGQARIQNATGLEVTYTRGKKNALLSSSSGGESSSFKNHDGEEHQQKLTKKKNKRQGRC